MADRIEKYSDKQVAEFSKKIRKIYTEAARDVKNKIKVFNERHEAISKKMLQDVKDGKITEEDYKKWMKGQVFQGEQWKRKLEDITKVYVNADEKAREILDSTQKNVFMQAANYTAYDIEKGTKGAVAFNIYDKKTVERLLKDNPKTLPEWKIDEPKDYTWNEKRVQNEVSKGIIQGESIDEIGTRLTGQLASSNANKMVMFARTAVTGAQNAGRVERMQESKSMGIRVQKRWIATHDDRTRDAHLELDGQVVDVDEPFVTSDGMEIMFPGDPNADPSLVYNCRCTLGYEYPANLDELIEDQTEEETTEEDELAWDPYGSIRDMSWGAFRDELPKDIASQIERELITGRGGMTINEYWRALVRGNHENGIIEQLLKDAGVSSQPTKTDDSKPSSLVNVEMSKDELMGYLEDELTRIPIDEEWLYQPEPGQEKDARENLIPFVGVGKDAELDEKLDYNISTDTVSVKDNVEVRIADLQTLQPTVDIHGVERAMHGKAGMGNPVKVVEYNGQLYVLDGNHRVNAAILRGDETINVQLIEKVDKQQEELKRRKR